MFCQKCDNISYLIEIVDAKGPFFCLDSDNYSDSEGEQTRLVCYCRQCNFSVDNTETTKSVYHNNYNIVNIKRTHLVNKFTAYDLKFQTLELNLLWIVIFIKG